MPRIIEGVHLTRMDLLKTKSRTKLAVKGHKLLKEKRDALMTHFFKVIDRAKGARQELAADLEHGRTALVKASAVAGTGTVASIAGSTPPMREVEFDFQNVMGVKIPKISEEAGETGKEYHLVFTTPLVSEAMHDFSGAAEKIVRLIEAEETLKRLGKEIKKVKRRTNALEYILIPNLEYTRKYIEFRLQEIERESFFRLKVIKKKKVGK